MDILISSNLERLLYHLYDQDAPAIAGLMADLQTNGAYTVSKRVLEKMDLFYGGFANEDQTKASIRSTYNDYAYLIDPHTAVANHVYTDYQNASGDQTKTIILSTASPFKFGRAVYESIFGPSDLDDYAILDHLSQKTKTPIPDPLKDLDRQKNRHHRQCTTDQMAATVVAFVKDQVATND